jgi:hypothetical protein
LEDCPANQPAVTGSRDLFNPDPDLGFLMNMYVFQCSRENNELLET